MGLMATVTLGPTESDKELVSALYDNGLELVTIKVGDREFKGYFEKYELKRDGLCISLLIP